MSNVEIILDHKAIELVDLFGSISYNIYIKMNKEDSIWKRNVML